MSFILKSRFSDEIKQERIEENIEDKENAEKAKRKQKAEEYVHLSYDNFLFHFTNEKQAIENDIKKCKKMEIHSYDRDFLWYIFLGILPYQSSSNWNIIITDKRSLYNSYKKELITKDINDFIEQKKIEKKFHEYFKFKEILSEEEYHLLDIIKIDVKRTFQTIELFHLDKIQKILITILFIFSKKNEKISYRQGMSELCAIFLYVLYKEQRINNSFIKDNKTFIFYLFHSNNEFLESDTYTMFSKFMLNGFINFFYYNDPKYENSFLTKFDINQKKEITKSEIENSDDSELKKRIYLIIYDKLSILDKNLYNFLSDKIEPDVFLFKWFICVFTREFKINQVLHLWDLIFLFEFFDKYYLKEGEIKNSQKEIEIDKKDNNKINEDKNKNDDISNNEINLDKNYIFIDYIILSMLFKIKNPILKLKNISKILAFLMNYPDDIDIKEIGQKALDFYQKINPNNKI